MEERITEVAGMKVGNYQLTFDSGLVVPLNMLQSDEIIYSEKSVYLILHGEIFNPSDLTDVFTQHSNTVSKIISCHEVHRLYNGETEFLQSDYRSGKLINIRIKNAPDETSSVRMVFKIDRADNWIYKSREESERDFTIVE